MKNIDEMANIMFHFGAGGKVEWRFSDGSNDWSPTENPVWDWSKFDYRIMDIKPSIDWSQIVRDYKWLAVDMDGRGFVFIDKPNIHKFSGLWAPENVNFNGMCEVTALVSFDEGNCDWKQSLVHRPE